MRTIPFLALTALLIPACASAQQKSTSGIACFENLATPEYPKAAVQAHVDGSVWVTAKLSSRGTVDKIDTQVVSASADGTRLLTPAAEKAARAAKINPACAGKTVSVVFRYQLYENQNDESRADTADIVSVERKPAAVTTVFEIPVS